MIHSRYAGACDLVSWIPPVGSLVPYVHHGAFHCIDREGRTHELGLGEKGDHEAAQLRVHSDFARTSTPELFMRLIVRPVPFEALSDHTPINYTSALWALR